MINYDQLHSVTIYFFFSLPFAYVYLITYPLHSTPLTDPPDTIDSAPHLLYRYTIHLLIRAPTCSPPIPSVIFCLAMHGPPLTPVDLPSSLYFINYLVARISPKLILLCTSLSHLGSAYPVTCHLVESIPLDLHLFELHQGSCL